MTEYETPILDDHLHLNADTGQGLAAVRTFANAGGTHLIIINRPSWEYGAVPETAADFRRGFEATCDIVEAATDELPGRAWAVLGVHPTLISRLVRRGDTPAEASELMQAGIDIAAGYVAEGKAIGIKSGRPHYEVPDAVWEASNEVMRHAFRRGAEVGGAVQLHAEAGEEFETVGDWAEEAGLPREQVVKHYADGPVKGITPSITADKEALKKATESTAPCLMETDFLDDPERPGAVLGPRTVPRRVRWLAENGFEGILKRAHVETPMAVYGIDTVETLDTTAITDS